MGKNKSDQQAAEMYPLSPTKQRAAIQKKEVSVHDRMFNSSAADTKEEIDAQSNNTGSVDSDLEREYRGVDKKNIMQKSNTKKDAAEEATEQKSTAPTPFSKRPW